MQLTHYIKKFFSILRNEDKKNLFNLFFLNLLNVTLELLTIGALFPLFYFLLKSDFSDTGIFQFLFLYDEKYFLFIILLLFLFIYLFKTVFIIFYQNKKLFYLSNFYIYLTQIIYKKYLSSNFLLHIKRNSSELIRNLLNESNIFAFIVFPGFINLFSELIKILLILLILLIYSPIFTLIIVISLFIGFLIFLSFGYEKIRHLGKSRQLYSALILQNLQEAFNGIKEIFIYKMQDLFLKRFYFLNNKNSEVGKKKDLLLLSFRPLFEFYAVFISVTLILFAYYFYTSKDSIAVYIGIFSYCLLKILPSVILIAKSIQDLKYNFSVIDIIFRELQLLQDKKNKNFLTFDKIFKLEFTNVKFRYHDSQKLILKKTSFKINGNDKVALIGKTGSGKTTVINIISGLLQIQGGNFKINDKKFNFNNYSISNSIGYVPQKVSILNNTILFNITLENQIQKIDLNRVYKILKIVYLSDFVKKFSNGINAILKENGSNISGGQIQRIGIARALYRNPYLLILDEATNALDDNTERLILKKLYKYLEDKIIIAISHKNSILKFSNKIFKIENQKIYTVK